MKLRVLFAIIAFGIGLAVPFLQLWLKLILVAAVCLMDMADQDEEKIKHIVFIIFAVGLILSYLYKLFFL